MRCEEIEVELLRSWRERKRRQLAERTQERDRREWKLYSTQARLISSICRAKWFVVPRGHHLDHRYSVYAGWKDGVPLRVLCNRNNLEILTIAANRRKHTKCSISIETSPKLI
jgi:hypothetical protein